MIEARKAIAQVDGRKEIVAVELLVCFVGRAGRKEQFL